MRQDHTISPSARVAARQYSAFASTTFHPTFVTTRTPLVSGWSERKSNSDFRKLQGNELRQNNATGKPCMIDMRELPAVHPDAVGDHMHEQTIS